MNAPNPMLQSARALTVFSRVIEYATEDQLEFINLTGPVEQAVGDSGIRDGIAIVQSLHATAALFVNEWQEALLHDFRALLEQSVPADRPWRHNDPGYSDCDRGNAAAHLRALLLGATVTMAVRDGRLVRGVWQNIILAELDGPRTRSISVQIMGA